MSKPTLRPTAAFFFSKLLNVASHNLGHLHCISMTTPGGRPYRECVAEKRGVSYKMAPSLRIWHDVRPAGFLMQAVQVKMARAALGLSTGELAVKAGVDGADVARLEDGASAEGTTLKALNLFFSAEGIEFIDSDGVRAKARPGTAFVTVDSLTSDNDGGEG